jgi:hypothetical protein
VAGGDRARQLVGDLEDQAPCALGDGRRAIVAQMQSIRS